MTRRLRRTISRIIGAFRRSRLENELDAEVRGHLAQLEERFLQQGMTAEEARYSARRAFGGIEPLKERHRDLRALPWIDKGYADVRYAFRNLRKNPSFTIVAMLTLALGIGAGAAIFSVVDTVLLRPLPYPEPERLVRVWGRDTTTGQQYLDVSAAEFRAIRNEAKSLSAAAAFSLAPRDIDDGDGHSTRLTIARATEGFFSLLGASFAIGRDFTQQEAQLQRSVVILSHRLWLSRYGGDKNIIGKKTYIRQEPHEIVGVLSQDHEFPRDADIFRPIRTTEIQDDDRELLVLARLSDGATIARASDEIAARVRQDRFSVWVQPLQAMLVRDVRAVLLILLAAVGLVVMIVCVNVAGLLLARAASRRREMAVRAALGAAPARLVGLCLAESLILAAAGGVLGMALAGLFLQAVVAIVPQELPRLSQVHVDVRVVAVMSVVTLLCGILFGVVPAWIESRQDLRSGLAASRNTAGPRGLAFRRGLVIAQVVLSTILIAAAAQVTEGFRNMIDFDRGFRNTKLIEMQVDSSQPGTANSIIALYSGLKQRVTALPGVNTLEMANFSAMLPRSLRRPIQVDGVEATRTPVDVYIGIVSEGYFQALGTPLREGRYFSTATDYRGASPVAIVNQAFVDAFIPNSSALARSVRVISQGSEPRRIVGVVGDLKPEVHSVATPAVYIPFGQEVWPSMTILIGMSTNDPEKSISRIREQIWAEVPKATLSNIGTLQEKVGRTLVAPRLSSTIVTILATFALLLASIGLYGLLSHLISNRRRELAIRLAIGAGDRGMVMMVVQHGLRLTLAGLALGLPVALASARWLSSSVYGVGWLEPAHFAAPVIVIAGVATLASLLPAIRVARIDAVEALRED